MIKKVVSKHPLIEESQEKRDLKYWLSRPPEERVSAVEILRKQVYGNTARLQRVFKIIKRTRG